MNPLHGIVVASTFLLIARLCWAEPEPAQGRIDELVIARLKQQGIAPAKASSDGVFVRRAYLDVIGVLPTAEESRQFLEDSDPDKRRKLVDRLLEREEFADYWSMKWCNLLRVRSEFPINLWPNAVQAYHRWIRSSLKENVPYDRFVREMLTASGSSVRRPPVNFYRAVESETPQSLAQAAALSFMGVRAEKWPKERLTNMAVFFSRVGYKATGEWKEEIVFFDLKTAAPASGVLPDGKTVNLVPLQDPRAVFADWLVDPANPWFARHVANRIWCWLLGRGIVHEPDDIRPDNPPRHPELLNYLGQELVASHYELKHVYRLILNSATYQLSAVPQSDRPEAEAEFACYPMRRLEAEVLIDAINAITGTTEKYTSRVPEPFTYIPEEQLAIQLPDASITSPFLDLFGRCPRNTGLESEQRPGPATAAQQLHLLNSSHIRRKLEQGPKLHSLFQATTTRRDLVTALYLTVLSRYPTATELATVQAYAAGGDPQRQFAADLVWALINTAEFQFRH